MLGSMCMLTLGLNQRTVAPVEVCFTVYAWASGAQIVAAARAPPSSSGPSLPRTVMLK
jgi:hypothetical protein